MESVNVHEAALSLLYVEDEPITRDAVCSLVRRKFPRLTIRTAANGEEGLASFAAQTPDLVVTDLKMPVLHGIEMARRMKGLTPDVPIIVTTAHSDMDYLIDAIEIGICHYVLKPIDKDKLFAALEGCIAGIVLRRQVQRQQDHIAKLSRAVEQSPSTIVITDCRGAIEYVNPRFSELTGYAMEEVLGRNARILGSGLTPREVYCDLWSHLLVGKEWRGELQNRKKNGDLYWEHASISPVWNTRGEITNFVAVKEDITERKEHQRQIEELNETLKRRAQELEVANQDLEAFGYTVSHDLRTPLTNINGYCQIILEMYGPALEEQCREFVQVMLSETLNMGKLIKTLLDFSRLSRQELRRSTVDLSAMAEAIAMDCRLRAPQRRIDFRIAQAVAVDGDADLLRVVLVNLLGNAWKYSAKNEEATIEFGVGEHGGKNVYFVRDNGAGFDMAYSKKLFKVFQRLHSGDDFEGIGIGLATVQRIVHRHGGAVWAEGEVGKGATFYFTLS